jgi:ubiquinone/menaquinone biosynthesis C-methylase UbiE
MEKACPLGGLLMKDSVDNRKLIQLSKKIKIGLEAFRLNGVVWTLLLLLYYLTSTISNWSFARMSQLRKAKGLPGLNSSRLNKLIWESWDWQNRGEEWTLSADWKNSVVTSLMRPHMSHGGVILEIGPGGGRWTEHLQPIASRLIVVDISSECLRFCRERFSSLGNIEYVLTSSSDLPGLGDDSVDSIWSFDAFVHINSSEVEAYFQEFRRVLKEGGIGVIQHGSNGGISGGWRSDLTLQKLNEILEAVGFERVDQFFRWSDESGSFEAGIHQDAVTIFRNPKVFEA